MKSRKKDDREGEGTKFTLDRKIFSSDIWRASPWKLKIWIYLIGHANHKDSTIMGIHIERGQLIRSYRKIAEDCSYKIGYRVKRPSPETIRKICDALDKEGRIKRENVKIIEQEDISQALQSGVRFVQQNAKRSGQYSTLFTVSNYNDLQAFQKTRSGQLERVHIVQDKNVLKESKDSLLSEKTLNPEKEEPSPKRKKKTEQPNPEVRIFILEWEKPFFQKFNELYTHNWGQEGKIIKNLLKTHSLSKLREFRESFFISEDKLIKGSDYSIGAFKQHLNRLVTARKDNATKDYLGRPIE